MVYAVGDSRFYLVFVIVTTIQWLLSKMRQQKEKIKVQKEEIEHYKTTLAILGIEAKFTPSKR